MEVSDVLDGKTYSRSKTVNSNGFKFKTAKSKDGQKLYFGHPQYLKLSQIGIHRLNRRKVHSHALDMAEKIKDFHFIDTIKVFKCDEDKRWLTAEGAHRVMALQTLFDKTDWHDIEVPVLVLPDIYLPEDEDQVLETIISFNHGNKPWTVRDYIQGWANSSKKKVYQEMSRKIDKFDNARRNKSYSISDSQLASLYTGAAGTTMELKTGSFQLKDYKRPFVHMLTEAIIDWKQRFNEDKEMGFYPTVCQNTIVFIHNLVIDPLLNRHFSSKEARIEWFDSFLQFYEEELYFLFDAEKRKAKQNRTNPLEVDKTIEQANFIQRLDRYMEMEDVQHLLELHLNDNKCNYVTYKSKHDPDYLKNFPHRSHP